jgi:F-type H+-transporting ATPase subunit b
MSQEFNILEINPGLMFWTIVTFVILVWILKKVAWGPILEALEKRENTIRDSLEEASRSREEAQKLFEEYNRKLEKAGEEAQKVLEEGRAMSENMKKEIVSKAREEAEEIVNRGKHEIELEREKAISEITKHAVDLSLNAASRVVKKTLTGEDHERIVLEAINDIKETK